MLHQFNLPWCPFDCVGHPFQLSPVPIILSVILHKNIEQGPFSEVREGDPKLMCVTMFSNGSMTRTASALFRVVAMMRSKFTN